MKTETYEYHIEGYPAARKSRCRIIRWKHDGVDCVVATELASNPGPSITNSAESLWTSWCTANNLDIELVRKFEHYRSAVGHPATMDGVGISFQHGAPQAAWYPVSANQFVMLTGRTITEIDRM